MRVALACPYAWDAPGGVQVHVRQLAARLIQRGHDVLVLAPASGRPAESHVVPVGRPVRIPYNGSVAPICYSARSTSKVMEVLREFEPDVVHAHEPLVPSTGMLAAMFARVAKARVVATFHAYADRAILFSLLAPTMRGIWRRIALRIAVSEAAASFVASRFPRDGIRIVPNGAEVDAFAGTEPAELPQGRRILFVNRLDRRKGFPIMVRAFGVIGERHPDALLVVAGDGEDRAAVGALPEALRDRVVMLGNVPHHLLPPYHAASEVFCAPATGRESFGIVLVEAMAAGLPVVASDIPGYREVVREGVEGILVPPSDPAPLAEAVSRLLGEPGVAKAMGEAGRARAKRYSWENVASEIESAYQEALDGR
jgi:phosphatidylinositol alpha-mannosyltransferase